MLQKLTDALIRNSKPGATRKRLSDGGGLYLEIAPAGGKWWRLKYRFGGKEKRISFGVYPEVSLKDAREKRDIAHKQLLQGVDPGEERKAIKTITSGCGTFEAVAREWHAKFAASEWST
ncbi:MAG: DUF4102 domain-containing protein, partial [Deltaproteobacteria bacterium]